MVVLTEFEEAVGPGAFRIVDHWETDRMAIRIAHPNDEHLLAYVALGNADGRYEVELETEPFHDSDLPYPVSGRFHDITLGELKTIVAQHLNTPTPQRSDLPQ
jgi:hypothetical protein